MVSLEGSVDWGLEAEDIDANYNKPFMANVLANGDPGIILFTL
jgi:hypothetical protein